MSVEAETWVWKQDVSPTRKLVLLALANRADEVGVCWPGQRGVAKRCRIKKRTLQYHLSELTKSGLVTSEPRFRKDGSRTSNIYRLSMQENAPSNVAGSVQEVADSEGSVQDSAPPSASIDVGVAQVIAPPSEPHDTGILDLSSNYQLKEEEEYIETPEWLKLLRELEEWPSKGRPHEESLGLWVVGQDYSPGLLEGSAIGLGAAQAKTLKGYKNLAKAFQDRLMKGFDDPAKRALRNNGARPVNPSLTANTTDAVRLAQEQNERG